MDFVVAIRDARACCVPLVVERVQFPVFAFVYLGHCLIQEVLRPEVVLVARRSACHTPPARQRSISGASSSGVARPSVHVGFRAALVGARVVVQVASRLGTFLRNLILVDHEVVVSILSRYARLLAIVLMAKCTVVSFGSWPRCVDHRHGSSRKGLSRTIEHVVMVRLTWKRLRVVKGLLAMVRIRRLPLCSLRAESLVRLLAVSGASTVEMDGRREGLDVSVLDVAAMMEERAATACLVCRAAQWSRSSASVRVHRVRLWSQSEGQVASVILRVVLRTAVDKDGGTGCIGIACGVAVEDTAKWVTHHVDRPLESVIVHLLRQAWLA